MPQDLESERIEMLWGKFDACQGHHYRGERFSSLIRKKTLALAYLATFEPTQTSLALDNRIVLNFIRNL
jgi:hypothetical protein